MPNGAYNGQKLIKLVNTKIIAKAPNTSATVPLMVLVKYKIATTTANTIRISLSVVPMFFFITSCFYLVKSDSTFCQVPPLVTLVIPFLCKIDFA